MKGKRMKNSRGFLWCLVGILVFTHFSTLYGQGMLIGDRVRLPRVRPIPMPTPEPEIYAIKEIHVDGKLTGQFAEIQVSQTFVNTTNQTIETSFVFPLPYDGAIDQMMLLVNGKEYPAKLLDAKKARETYEQIVRSNRDPALLEWIGTGMFQTSVFPIPAKESRTVTLRYTQLLRKEHDVVDYLFPLSTAKYTSKPLEKLSLTLDIVADHELKNIYSPTHDVEIKRIGDKRATVKYEESNILPESDFRLLFDSRDGELSTQILSYRENTDEDGYFMLMTTPKITESSDKPISKTIVFVLDVSGSMAGKKIKQAVDSLTFVLDKLNDGDLFNIITFNSLVRLYEPELTTYDAKTRKAAMDYCGSIRAGGGTNIDEALVTAMKQFQDNEQPGYVIFLTDGCPTVGEQNDQKIASHVKEVNKARVRVFSFGVGFDLNSRLIDKISRDNFGQSDFVLPEENIEEKISKLYGRISAPVLADAKLTIFKDGQAHRGITNQIYPGGAFDLFAGEQLVMVGRYSDFGAISIMLQGEVGGEEKRYSFDGTFTKTSDDARFAFIERIWAIRRVGEIIDEIDLNGKNSELVDELVRLATKHGILTPYTSFLADDSTDIRATSSNNARALDHTYQLNQLYGMGGVAQRGTKGSMQKAMRTDADTRNRFAKMAPTENAELASNSSMSGGRTGAGGMSGGMPGGGMMGYSNAGSGMGDVGMDQKAVSQATVRNIANQAFYLKNGTWEDASVSESQLKNIKVVKQFSDEYFSLVAEHGKSLSQYLVFDEPVLVNFKGQAYRFEP